MSTTANSKTRILVEGALMIALATVLSYLKFFDLPQGGSITLEMLPLVLMGLRNGPKWGCFTGFVHGLLQMMLGFQNVLYCATLPSQLACVLLDYLVAFTVLGFAPVFARFFKNDYVGVTVGAVAAGLLRFACSFLSGILVWGAYAPEGTPVWIYSLTYNGSYMVPNCIIMAVICLLLRKFAPKLFGK
ncbi:MAG: energy-coupled thiamine transporter ThiT [Gemmiger sp.]|nr:energy-coupled thiamine transporter ThiT [Gemmiger sp.]